MHGEASLLKTVLFKSKIYSSDKIIILLGGKLSSYNIETWFLKEVVMD